MVVDLAYRRDDSVTGSHAGIYCRSRDARRKAVAAIFRAINVNVDFVIFILTFRLTVAPTGYGMSTKQAQFRHFADALKRD